MATCPESERLKYEIKTILIENSELVLNTANKYEELDALDQKALANAYFNLYHDYKKKKGNDIGSALMKTLGALFDIIFPTEGIGDEIARDEEFGSICNEKIEEFVGIQLDTSYLKIAYKAASHGKRIYSAYKKKLQSSETSKQEPSTGSVK